jgi:hypothetical protein
MVGQVPTGAAELRLVVEETDEGNRTRLAFQVPLEGGAWLVRVLGPMATLYGAHLAGFGPAWGWSLAVVQIVLAGGRPVRRRRKPRQVRP